MNVLIDTRNPIEYLRLRRVAEAQEGIHAFRAPLFGHDKLQRHYDVIVSARGDEQNMALARRWKSAWGDTFIILVMDSERLRINAMQFHVYDYLTRPLDEERFARSLRDAAAHFAGKSRSVRA